MTRTPERSELMTQYRSHDLSGRASLGESGVCSYSTMLSDSFGLGLYPLGDFVDTVRVSWVTYKVENIFTF